jgi:hypothetical protein
VPEVEDLELGGGGHERKKYSVELIAIDVEEGTIEVGGAGILTGLGRRRGVRTNNCKCEGEYRDSSPSAALRIRMTT